MIVLLPSQSVTLRDHMRYYFLFCHLRAKGLGYLASKSLTATVWELVLGTLLPVTWTVLRLRVVKHKKTIKSILAIGVHNKHPQVYVPAKGLGQDVQSLLCLIFNSPLQTPQEFLLSTNASDTQSLLQKLPHFSCLKVINHDLPPSWTLMSRAVMTTRPLGPLLFLPPLLLIVLLHFPAAKLGRVESFIVQRPC